MDWKRPIQLGLVTILALSVIATPLLGCAPNGEKDGSKVLKVGFSLPYTGPAAEKGRPMGNGQLDAVKYINEELGGVNGYKIDALWRDNEYDAAKAPIIVNEFIDSGCLLFTTASSKIMGASMETANRAKFPGIVIFSAPSLTHPPQHIYGQMPDYGDDWAAFAKYYLENMWKKPGKPKMALHLLNNSTGYGARDAARALAEQIGIDLIWPASEHSATTISEIESLTRIKAQNPDILYISSTPQPTSIIIKDAVKLGMFPGVTIASGHAGFTKALIDLAKTDAEGVYGVFPTVNWDENVPGMAKMTEYSKKYHLDDYGNMDYITAWATSLIAADILRLAVDKVGIDKLTPQAVEEYGFKKLNNFDVGGLHGPVSFTPDDNRLSKSVRIFQVKSGSLAPVTGWVEAPLIKYEGFDWFGK